MNAHFDARTGTQEIVPPADGMSHLSALMQKIAQDETLPAPAPESVFVGDGDYRAIGLEYLGAAPVRGTRYGGGMETLWVKVKVDHAGRPNQWQSQSQE